MRYLSVVILFVFVWVVSQLVPQANDERFYLIQAWWSLLVLFVFYKFCKNRIGLIICVLETTHIMLNLFTCVDYILKLRFIYDYYEIILNTINGIEAIVLIIGAPWIGVTNGHKSIYGDVFFRNTHHTRRYKGFYTHDGSKAEKNGEEK